MADERKNKPTALKSFRRDQMGEVISLRTVKIIALKQAKVRKKAMFLNAIA
jgi:hypothetical protein